MALSIDNTQTTAFASASSVVVTKPTGLAVGDLMMATIGYIESGSSRTFTTPAGWTQVQKREGLQTPAGGFNGIAVYGKIADASDVSASNFTFTISGAAQIAGSITLVDGDIVTSFAGDSEQDETTSGTASLSFTTAVTPVSKISIVFLSIVYHDLSLTNPTTVSGYASTPSYTFTEHADINYKSGSNGGGLSTASSVIASTTQITNYSATISEAVTTHLGVLTSITGVYDDTGANVFFTTSPANFTSSGTNDALAPSVLATETAVANTQSGTGTSPTPWTNESKPSTTWTNETL